MTATQTTAPSRPRRVPPPQPSLTGRAAQTLRRVSPMLLRGSLAVTFIWFGALKVAGVPTLPGTLIAAIFPWVDPSLSVPAVGAFEVLLGGALLVGRLMPLVALATTAHLAGTFLVLLIRPDVAFQGGNPLLLSAEGEFVVKNLVLIAAALTLASTTARARAR
jgi:putative oxidoreductase